MAEEKKLELTPAQKKILEKIYTNYGQSTFLLLTNDEEDAQIDTFRQVIKSIDGKQITPEEKEGLTQLENKILEIHKARLVCAHCGKLAKVEGDLRSLKPTCDCEDAKKEISSKEEINKKQEALDQEYNTLQKGVTNKAISLYKENYKKIVEDREKALAKADEEILSAAELV